MSRHNNDKLSTRQTLTLIALAGVVTLLMTLVPGLTLLNYPFRLLLTIVHELSHGLTAMLTGGDFIRFVVFSNGAGLAYTAGGWRLLVIPAGYLGTALFGAILILLGRSHTWSRVGMGVIGAVMFLFSLRYGIPTIFSTHFLSGLLTTISGVIFGSIFLIVAARANASGVVFLIHFVAIQAGLAAFGDITTLIGLSSSLTATPANDAQSMANLTYIPAIVWAILWAVVAVGLIGGAIAVAWLPPLTRNARSNAKKREEIGKT